VTSAYFDPPRTHAAVHSLSEGVACPSAAGSCFAPHRLSLIFPVHVWPAAFTPPIDTIEMPRAIRMALM